MEDTEHKNNMKRHSELLKAIEHARAQREAKDIKDYIKSMNPADRQKYLLDIRLLEIQETAYLKQIEYHENQINDIRDKSEQKNRELIINALIAFLGVALGWLLNSQVVTNKIIELPNQSDFLKIQVIDTCYKHSNK